MKDLPIVAKLIINFILFVLYLLVASVIFSFLFPIVMQILGLAVPDPVSNVELFNKIQLFIILLVLIVSLVFRKFFYLNILSQDTEVHIHETTYVSSKKHKKNKKHSKNDKAQDGDDDIKIYVDKEIK